VFDDGGAMKIVVTALIAGMITGHAWSGAAAAADHVTLQLPVASYHYDRSPGANEVNPGIGLAAAWDVKGGAFVLGGGLYLNSGKVPAVYGMAGYLVPVGHRVTVGAGILPLATFRKSGVGYAVGPAVLIGVRITEKWSINARANRGSLGFWAGYSLK